MADLGDRYPPTSQTDLESHARRLRLLCEDLSEVPPHILSKAIDRYVKIPNSEFLPKAGKLIEISTAIAAELEAQRHRASWIPPQQRQPVEPRPFAPPLSSDEIRKMPPWIIKMGVTIGDLDPQKVAEIRGSA